MGSIHHNNLKSLLSVILTLSLLTGCQKTPLEELSCNIESIQSLVNTQNADNNLDISINVDGSDSMLGYVTTPNSNYMRTIELIANSIIERDNITVEYRRIGESQPLTKTRFRQDAQSPIFYNSNDDTYKPITSPIQTVITSPVEGREKLTMIVTDLEGDDAGKVFEALTKNYFDRNKQDYTVGIWAVKSQFNGTIFNPNTGKAQFVYNTEGKSPEFYRPFYVLFIGQYEQIANYFEQLKKLDSQFDNYSEMFIFPTHNIVMKNPINLGTLEARENNSQLPDNNQLVRIFALQDRDVIVKTKNANNEPYELFSINNIEPTLTINYQVPFPSIKNLKGGNYALSIDENNLITETKVYTFNPQNQVQQSSVETSESEEKEDSETINNGEENNQTNEVEKQLFALNSSGSLKQGLTIKDLKLDQENQTLQFATDININNLPNPQIYLFEVDLILDDLTGKDWWTEWSAVGGNNDGSKTQNLSIFMNKLKSLNLKTLSQGENDPVIGRFCFALQKQ